MKNININISCCKECPYCEFYWANEYEAYHCKNSKETICVCDDEKLLLIPNWCLLDEK